MKNKYNVLLVEDDINLGTILKEYLDVKGYNVTHVQNGEDGYKEYRNQTFDMCILDVMMPKKDGFTLAREIRKHDEKTPVIFLTAKSMHNDKVEGFNSGGDDYITKPFSTEELLLRIQAVLKRTSQHKNSNQNHQFSIGKYKYNSIRGSLIINTEERRLTSKENELLKLLVTNKNEVLSRSEALKTIWNDDNYFNSRSMDVYITKLRGYLKEDSNIEIKNIHGHGFMLSEH